MTAPYRFRQADRITMQELDGDIFLADEDTGVIFHLNALGGAFWRTLETPHSLATIIDIFCRAFPDQQQKTISEDLHNLVAELERNGLIEKVP